MRMAFPELEHRARQALPRAAHRRGRDSRSRAIMERRAVRQADAPRSRLRPAPRGRDRYAEPGARRAQHDETLSVASSSAGRRGRPARRRGRPGADRAAAGRPSSPRRMGADAHARRRPGRRRPASSRRRIDVVRRAVDRFLREQLMTIRRHHGDRIEWERAQGIWPGWSGRSTSPSATRSRS